jgi:molybdate transport system permease protein
VLPPVVVGFFLLSLLGRQGPVGVFLHDAFGLTVAFTWQGAAIASSIMVFPLMVRAIRLSIENVDSGLEAAARTLGASPFRVFYSITLPLISPGILAGIILAFARSLGEFGATITFVSNIPGETRTLPLAIFSLVQTPSGDAGALRLVVFSIILALAALLISEYLAARTKRRIEG